MSACIGCSCERADTVAGGGRLLLSTRVSHTLVALRAALGGAGVDVAEPAPGMLEIPTADVPALVAGVRACLSSVEAAEVRAVQLRAEHGPALVAAALSAQSLAQLGARAEHADLLPLFTDEARTFRSVYQPIVTLGSGDGQADIPHEGRGGFEVIGYEALLRATGPAGQLSPASLFGAAERAGWLHVLDRVGRTTALRGAAGWLGTDLLFVNFLPTTIYRPQVCLRTTEQAAREAGLALDQLVFEVTESERVADLEHLADVFAYYRDRGCKVALDDLGAGYSSLNMLVRLQPDVVKLDKDLVQRLPDPVSAAVVTAVVEITHSYGGKVLAECVETAEQAGTARDLGVDLGQGWYFGKPQERTPTPPARPARPSRTPARVRWPSPADFDGNDPVVVLPEVLSDPRPSTPAPFQARGAGVDPGTTLAGAPLADLTALVPASRAPGPGGASGRSADIEALLAGAVSVSTVGVTICDAREPDLPLIYVNDAFERATGYHSPEVLGRNCRFLQGPGTDPAVVAGLRQAVREGRDHVAVLLNYRKDGQAWWNELRLSPVHDTRGQVTHYFGFQNDVTARVEAEREVVRLAYHDLLTDLPNRAHLLRALRGATVQASATGTRLAVLFLDLDGFKAVNDRHGHAVGDLTLAAAAACLRGALREGDLLARYSGDEFVAVLTGVPPETAHRVAQRTADTVLGSLAAPLHVAGERVQLGVSIGVAVFPDQGSTPEQLLQAADRAMYSAKQTGGGRALMAPAESRTEQAPG